MRNFRDLQVWQRAHQLVLSIYKLTATLPSEEKYGITSQIRRAALSISNNVAEGCKRKSQTDFARFLNIAEGSCSETDYLLLVIKDLGYATADSVGPLAKELSEIERMLFSLRTKVEHPDQQ